MGERKRARRSSREENRGTAQIPLLDPSDAAKQKTQGGEGERKREQEEPGIPTPTPNPGPISQSGEHRGLIGSEDSGGAAMNEKASVSKELNAKHKKVRLLLPAPHPSPSIFVDRDRALLL